MADVRPGVELTDCVVDGDCVGSIVSIVQGRGESNRISVDGGDRDPFVFVA
jgi:hypothetical protein